jgi:hypothetical protein
MVKPYLIDSSTCLPAVSGLQALALTLLRDIAAGMNYLHSRSVIHGDLKPGAATQ